MTVQDLRLAVAGLDRQDLAEFSAWFEEYRESAWNEQIALDVRLGRFELLFDHDARDCQIWSPYEAYGAAEALLNLLQADTHRSD